ncbi:MULTISPECIES: hypothetical protein [unclassified Mesorhizobium]|uniref:hypothetical protein n=1 Tax=unclassified Mesorhizobium TaxID=325217 RepID=UPI00333D8C38
MIGVTAILTRQRMNNARPISNFNVNKAVTAMASDRRNRAARVFMGLFAGGPANLEAYGFHAREFYRAISLHAGLSHNDQASGRTLPPVLPPAGR